MVTLERTRRDPQVWAELSAPLVRRTEASPPADLTVRRVSRRRWSLAALAVALVLLIAAMAAFHLPYYSIGPGVALPVDGMVTVDGGATFPPNGHILFVTVDSHRATALQAFRGWLDPDTDVRPARQVLAGANPRELRQRNLDLMEQAKHNALVVALRRLGHRVRGDDDLPVVVHIDSHHVGGPSAGLAFTLAVLDVLSPGELTGQRQVAATGTIGLDGKVGPVGGVAQKAAAARRAGAEVFLVPTSGYQTALANAGGMHVVGVDSLDAALAALARLA